MTAAPAAIADATPVSARNWIVACESGENWQTNIGSDCHDGPQFSQQAWSGHGGDQCTPAADQAIKEQQTETGECVLVSQGTGAWPNYGGPLG